MAHQNKRLRNIFVYLTHIVLALALLFLAICANTEIASHEYTETIMLFCCRQYDYLLFGADIKSS
jgi:hypothetical protein